MLVIILLVLWIISGCSYPVTFASSHQEAMLMCNGQEWDYTPFTLYYDIKEKQKFLDLSNCEARWVSGAWNRYGIIPLEKFPDGVTTTVQRPTHFEGYEKDAEFALQVQQMRAMQRQAIAAENQAYEAQRMNRELNNIDNNLNNINNNLFYRKYNNSFRWK